MKKLLIIIGLITGACNLFAAPIHLAAGAGQVDVVKDYISNGFNINLRDEKGRTPLMHAAGDGYLNVAELIIAAGADLDLKDNEEWTALHHAAYYGQDKIAKVLIANGANVMIDNAGQSPLDIAIKRIHPKVVEGIITGDISKSINKIYPNGFSALHFAVYNNSKELAEILIKNGADINYRIKTGVMEGKTPLDFAYIKNSPAIINSEIANLIYENGGRTESTLIENEITALKNTSNNNPTDEWPRKLWEIDLGQKIDSIGLRLQSGGDNSVLVKIYLNNQTRSYWISNTGSLYLLPESNQMIHTMFLSNDALMYKAEDLVIGLFRHKGTIIKKTFQRSKLTDPDWDTPTVPTVQVSYEGSVITAWDFTPPTLASINNEGGNNGGNTAMSRLSIGTSGPDISIAADGKLGGPAELQKSNDLKNWRKLGDVPADGGQLLITPRDNGNEFFRLRKKE